MPDQPSDTECRLIALASAAEPGELAAFKPTQSHQRLADALVDGFDGNITELADAAGISRAQLYRVLTNRTAVAWITAQSSRLSAACLGAVHARILQMALTAGSASWARLYLERFDEDFKKQKVLEQATFSQTNQYKGMTDAELSKIIERKTIQNIGVIEHAEERPARNNQEAS